jgi:hypothetical protein
MYIEDIILNLARRRTFTDTISAPVVSEWNDMFPFVCPDILQVFGSLQLLALYNLLIASHDTDATRPLIFSRRFIFFLNEI